MYKMTKKDIETINKWNKIGNIQVEIVLHSAKNREIAVYEEGGMATD